MLRVLISVGFLAQAGVSPCLHGPQETEAERGRRTDAVAAMRMIDWVMQQHGLTRLHTVWWVMGNLSAVITLKGTDGRVGELATRISWGGGEPLPGWRLTLSRSLSSNDYWLIDTRDPCALKLMSTDPEVVPPRPYGIMPLDAIE